MTTLMLAWLSFGSFAYARLDIQKDCSDAAGIFHIPAEELSAFRSWCENFEGQCYQIESEAASACGSGGTQETHAIESVSNTGVALEGNTSYQTGTAVADAAVSEAILVRKFQLQLCSRKRDDCDHKSSTFTQSSLTPQPRLACSNFTPESDKWSPGARSAPNLCAAIALEYQRVESEMKIAEPQKAGIKSVSGLTKAAP